MKVKYTLNGIPIARLLQNIRDYNFFISRIKKGMSVADAYDLTQKTKNEKRRKPEQPIMAKNRKYFYKGQSIRDLFKDKKDRNYFYVMRHNGLSVKEAVERTIKVQKLRKLKWEKWKNGKEK